MASFFTIVDVLPVGDLDSGEAHIVTIHHNCKEGPPGIAIARFGKLRSSQTTVACPECLAPTTVVKENGGDIFIQKEM